jgi:tRNA threonylcarbamoyladenosine biosynthesis protein TsaB
MEQHTLHEAKDRQKDKSIFLVAVDARMSQVYWAIYETNQATVELVGKEQLGMPNEVKMPENNKNDKIGGIGDGFELYKEIFVMLSEGRPIFVSASKYPSAEALLELAKVKFSRGEWVAASCATPIYLERG